MGRYTTKFRELLEHVPRPTDREGFTPDLASIIITQVINNALHVIAEQEETIDDLEEEVTKLQSQLIESAPDGAEADWLSRAKYKDKKANSETNEMLNNLWKKEKDNE
jgi:hypothetical protein